MLLAWKDKLIIVFRELSIFMVCFNGNSYFGGLFMRGWFTVEEIDGQTLAISEYQHWEQVHSYLVIGSEKAALIDTGLGVSNIKNIVTQLTDLPIQVVTTHVHWDHIGGHSLFEDIAVHRYEEGWLAEKFPIPLAVVKSNLMKDPCDFPASFKIDDYTIYQGKPTLVLDDNDIINLGNRKLQVIHTPGHSPGHICLYESDTGYLFTGDLIYKGTLYAFYPSTNPVDFMNSVKKLLTIPVKRILPAHNSLNISVSLISDINEAFSSIEKQGNLVQGNGVFDFGEFRIWI